MPCRPRKITSRTASVKATMYNMELNIEGEGAIDQETFDPLRTPYEIDELKFQRTGSAQEEYAFLVRYAILAPSSHNTQPWKFELRDDGIGVYADYTRRLPVADPGSRELLMGVGAAIFNLRVAAAHFHFDCRVDYNHSGDSERPLAFLSLSPMQPGRNPDPSLDRLFPWLVKRHTNRNPFLVSRVPETVLARLRMVSEGTQTLLHVSTDGSLNQQVADLVAAADIMQQADPSFRQENAEWVRTNWTRRTDGVPGAAIGVRGVTSALAPWATRVLDLGKIRAAADKNLCVQAPGLMILQGEDSVPLWLEVGEVLERLLLSIMNEGLQYSFFNMPIELPELRNRLRGLLGLTSWPQLLLRIGYCLIDPAPTPRRPLEDVLMKKRSLV